jgi:hypothetical protein
MFSIDTYATKVIGFELHMHLLGKSMLSNCFHAIILKRSLNNKVLFLYFDKINKVSSKAI